MSIENKTRKELKKEQVFEKLKEITKKSDQEIEEIQKYLEQYCELIISINNKNNECT
jgi:hypothetical protein